MSREIGEAVLSDYPKSLLFLYVSSVFYTCSWKQLALIIKQQPRLHLEKLLYIFMANKCYSFVVVIYPT